MSGAESSGRTAQIALELAVNRTQLTGSYRPTAVGRRMLSYGRIVDKAVVETD